MAGLTDALGLAGVASPWGAIGAGASALYGIGSGIAGSIKANRLEKNNIRPIAQVNQNYLQNVGQAGLMAQTGLASRVYNNTLTGLNTGLTAGLRQAGRSGGTGSIASILRGYGAGIDNLGAQDQQAQLQNQRTLMQQRGILAQDQQRVWQWNKANPYMETAQRVASLRNASSQNIFGGIQAFGNVAGLMNGQGGEQASTMPRVDAVNSTLQPITNTQLSWRPQIGTIGATPQYFQGQLQNSLNTGYGVRPFTPNA